MTLAHTFILSIKDAEKPVAGVDALTFEKHIIYVGHFDKWEGLKLAYSFDVTEEDIDNWIKNFNGMRELGIEIPAPLVHSFNPEDKRGEWLELSKRHDSKGRLSLYGKIKFKSLEHANNLKDSNVSIFAPPVLRHQDKVFVQPIQHIGLTDYPVIGDLEKFTIAASIVEGVKPTMLKALCEALGITVEDGATDEQMVELIKAEFESLKSKAEEKPKEDEAKPPIAASLTPAEKVLLKDNRELKIDALLRDRKITPAQATKLKQAYTGDALALSDGFDAAYGLALSNEPLSVGSGKPITGSQHKPAPVKSAIVEDAEKRAGKK